MVIIWAIEICERVILDDELKEVFKAHINSVRDSITYKSLIFKMPFDDIYGMVKANELQF